MLVAANVIYQVVAARIGRAMQNEDHCFMFLGWGTSCMPGALQEYLGSVLHVREIPCWGRSVAWRFRLQDSPSTAVGTHARGLLVGREMG